MFRLQKLPEYETLSKFSLDARKIKDMENSVVVELNRLKALQGINLGWLSIAFAEIEYAFNAIQCAMANNKPTQKSGENHEV